MVNRNVQSPFKLSECLERVDIVGMKMDINILNYVVIESIDAQIRAI